MASWKKVIVSGSNISQLNNDSAYLIDNAGIQALGAGIVSSSGQVSDLAGVNNNQITITAGNGISFASGDGVFTLNQGSDETIADIAVDLNELGTETTIAQDDFIAMVDATDNGSQKITFSNLEDEIFGNVSGDATIAAGGALTIANDAIDLGMLNDGALSVTASGDVAGQAALSTDAVQIALTIQSNAVENSMMADDSVDSAEIVDGAIDNVHFSAGAKTAISGAFTDDSASFDTRISSLETGAYDLDFQGDSGTGTITNAETLDIAGGTNITTTANANELSVALDARINLTDVTASLKGNVDGDLTGTAGNASDLHNQSITSGEASQIGNIDSVTISNTQWGYLGGQDQSVATSDSPSFTNLTVTGDLTVEGSRTELNVANLNVEDQFILLNSGSTSGDSGIIFGGTGDGVANAGHAIFVDDSNGNGSVFGFAENLAHDVITGGTPTSKLGNIVEVAGAPSGTPTFQGVGTIGINTVTQDIWIYS